MPANNSTWIIGDSLLTEAAGHYGVFKKKKGESQQKLEENHLYIETMYAIQCISTGIYTVHQATNMPNLLLNVLVDTLNAKAKIPHTLVIVLNDHKFWNQSFDLLQFQMERIITKFIKEIQKIVEARNWSLPPKAVNWDYPRIFITKVLPLPNGMECPYPKGFKTNCRKFNKLLLRGEVPNKYFTINMAAFTCENDNNLFNKKGGLTDKGFREFWVAIRDAIHKSDNARRIKENKMKAKMIAKQITLNNGDVNQYNDKSDGNLSDIEALESETTHNTAHHSKPADSPKSKPKRSLINAFNASEQHLPRYQSHSPAPSDLSEYYTAAGNFRHSNLNDTQLTNLSFHHKPYRGRGRGRSFHHKQNFYCCQKGHGGYQGRLNGHKPFHGYY